MRPVALITGATGGLGRAFAHELADRGFALILSGRNRDRLDELAASIPAADDVAGPPAVRTVLADLGTEEGIRTVVDTVREQRVDLLVNNAGFGSMGAFVQTPLERSLEEESVDVRAVLALSHAALAGMIARGNGAIVNIASVAAFQPLPRMAVYGAAKAFVERFSLALAEEARPHGVRVTSVHPGPVDTGFFDASNAHAIKISTPVDPRTVVRAALDASDRGRSRVVCPGSYRGLDVLTRLLPPTLAARLTAVVTRPRSRRPGRG